MKNSNEKKFLIAFPNSYSEEEKIELEKSISNLQSYISNTKEPDASCISEEILSLLRVVSFNVDRIAVINKKASDKDKNSQLYIIREGFKLVPYQNSLNRLIDLLFAVFNNDQFCKLIDISYKENSFLEKALVLCCYPHSSKQMINFIRLLIDKHPCSAKISCFSLIDVMETISTLNNKKFPTVDYKCLIEIIKTFVNAKVDFSVKDKSGSLFLHYFVLNDMLSDDSLMAYIELHPRIKNNKHYINKLGNTPLHTLCCNKNATERSIKLLLELGISPEMKNSNGNKAVDMANKYENKHLASFLFNCNPSLINHYSYEPELIEEEELNKKNKHKKNENEEDNKNSQSLQTAATNKELNKKKQQNPERRKCIKEGQLVSDEHTQPEVLINQPGHEEKIEQQQVHLLSDPVPQQNPEVLNDNELTKEAQSNEVVNIFAKQPELMINERREETEIIEPVRLGDAPLLIPSEPKINLTKSTLKIHAESNPGSPKNIKKSKRKLIEKGSVRSGGGILFFETQTDFSSQQNVSKQESELDSGKRAENIETGIPVGNNPQLQSKHTLKPEFFPVRFFQDTNQNEFPVPGIAGDLAVEDNELRGLERLEELRCTQDSPDLQSLSPRDVQRLFSLRSFSSLQSFFNEPVNQKLIAENEKLSELQQLLGKK